MPLEQELHRSARQLVVVRVKPFDRCIQRITRVKQDDDGSVKASMNDGAEFSIAITSGFPNFIAQTRSSLSSSCISDRGDFFIYLFVNITMVS